MLHLSRNSLRMISKRTPTTLLHFHPLSASSTRHFATPTIHDAVDTVKNVEKTVEDIKKGVKSEYIHDAVHIAEQGAEFMKRLPWYKRVGVIGGAVAVILGTLGGYWYYQTLEQQRQKEEENEVHFSGVYHLNTCPLVFPRDSNLLQKLKMNQKVLYMVYGPGNVGKSFWLKEEFARQAFDVMEIEFSNIDTEETLMKRLQAEIDFLTKTTVQQPDEKHPTKMISFPKTVVDKSITYDALKSEEIDEDEAVGQLMLQFDKLAAILKTHYLHYQSDTRRLLESGKHIKPKVVILQNIQVQQFHGKFMETFLKQWIEKLSNYCTVIVTCRGSQYLHMHQHPKLKKLLPFMDWFELSDFTAKEITTTLQQTKKANPLIMETLQQEFDTIYKAIGGNPYLWTRLYSYLELHKTNSIDNKQLLQQFLATQAKEANQYVEHALEQYNPALAPSVQRQQENGKKPSPQQPTPSMDSYWSLLKQMAAQPLPLQQQEHNKELFLYLEQHGIVTYHVDSQTFSIASKLLENVLQ